MKLNRNDDVELREKIFENDLPMREKDWELTNLHCGTLRRIYLM